MSKVLQHWKRFLLIWPVGFVYTAWGPLITNPTIQQKYGAVLLTMLFVMLVGMPLYMIVLTKRVIPQILADKSESLNSALLIVAPTMILAMLGLILGIGLSKLLD